jgi:hypothetical protein
MKVRDSFLRKLAFGLGLAFGITYGSSAQVFVDGKNVSADKDVTYIQFLYFVDKSTFKPVYLIDFGMIDNQQSPPKKQIIKIDKTEINDSMSPVYILNLFYKSGWEYMGDETFTKLTMMEDWYSFTLKRKR